MVDEHQERQVRHEVAAVVSQPGGGDEGPLLTRYVNMVAWWPVAITLLILSSNVGVWFYFLKRDIEATYFMGFEDYAAATVLGGIPFLAYGVLLLIVVNLLSLIVYPFVKLINSNFRKSNLPGNYDISVAVVCFLIVCAFIFHSVDRLTYGKVTGEDIIFVSGFSIASLFLLSFILKPWGRAGRQAAILIQFTGALLAPGVSAYMYFKWVHTTGTPLRVNMDTIKDVPENDSLVALCTQDNELVWMGTKALVIACGPKQDDKNQELKREYLIITNPEGKHVSHQRVVTPAANVPVATPAVVEPLKPSAPLPSPKGASGRVAPPPPPPPPLPQPADSHGKIANLRDMLFNQTFDRTGGEGLVAQGINIVRGSKKAEVPSLKPEAVDITAATRKAGKAGPSQKDEDALAKPDLVQSSRTPGASSSTSAND